MGATPILVIRDKRSKMIHGDCGCCKAIEDEFPICKEYTSYSRKLATKTVYIQQEELESTEDKHETNHINNKYNVTNMNTRKMHNT